MIEKLKLEFNLVFGQQPQHMSFAPGRVNIIGGHTDYSGGFVLPFALKQGIHFAIAPSSRDSIKAVSKDLNESISIGLDERERGLLHWKNCVIGVLRELEKLAPIIGFDLMIYGDLPFGAGLSSSSALCCGLIQSISELLNINLSKLEVAEMAFRIEHDFIGIPCGKMDQLVIAHNIADQALLINCKDHNFRSIPLNFDAHCFALIRSNVIRKLHETDYGLASRECASVFEIAKVHFPELKVLSDLNIDQVRVLEKFATESQIQRVNYLLNENARVLRAADSLGSEALGELISASHRGLKELYRVTCAEVDFLAEEAIKLPGILGARMIGGGFGGCVLVLMKNQAARAALEPMLLEYEQRFEIRAEVMAV